MDPISLASAAVGLLAPFVAKGAEKMADKLGEAGAQALTGLLARLRARWAGDAEAAGTLSAFEAKPERHAATLQEVLAERLQADPAFAQELASALQATGPVLHLHQEVGQAEQVTGLRAEHVGQGRIDLTQLVTKAGSVLGADIKTFGGR